MDNFEKCPLLYLIMTHNGKPIFCSSGSEEEIVRYTAVIQAIVSCFESPQELKTIESDGARFVIYSASPLTLVAVDRQQRSVSQLKGHLELLHAQILSVLTKQQLEKQVENKPTIDLRSILGGTEVFLKALVDQITKATPWSWLGALESLDLPRSLRNKINSALLEAKGQSSLLYGIVVSDGKLTGVVRPKQHSLHPPDLHLVFSMLFKTTVFTEGENWVPICFPKFNPNGFLYAYIRLIGPPYTYLVLVSPDRHGFFDMQNVGNSVIKKIGSLLVETINLAASKGRFECSDLHIDPIEFFVYKSRAHVQFIQSRDPDEQSQIQLKFAQLQSRMTYQRQRICWYNDINGSLLGWHTPAFELYCYAGSDDMEKVSHSVKTLVAWIRKYETRLFIVDGATF